MVYLSYSTSEVKTRIFSAKSEGRRTIRFRMGHDTSSKQHNSVSDVIIPNGRTQYDALLDAK